MLFLMQFLDVTLPTAAENLAFDEALLQQAEAGRAHSVLRLWESPQLAVVVGRSSRVADEVDETKCQQAGVPILRRTSGGAAVLIGPGCLMVSVVLGYEQYPHLRMIDQAHCFVLQRNATALGKLVEGVTVGGVTVGGVTVGGVTVGGVTVEGTSDLALAGKKFSGNSLRCGRDHFLYHGTVLYDFDLDRVAELLKSPPRQPAYRAMRDHTGFLTNLPVAGVDVRRVLRDAWRAERQFDGWPEAEVERLVAEKYCRDEWNFRR
jgi:lipoate-protein ligase A